MVIAQVTEPLKVVEGSLSYENSSFDLEPYAVVPAESSGEVSAGVAIKFEDQIGRLRVATDRYQAEGYLAGIHTLDIPKEHGIEDILAVNGLQLIQETLSEDQFADFWKHGIVFNTDFGPLYIDRYHWSSIPLVAKTLSPSGEQMYIGSARIIFRGDDSCISLPIFDDPTIHIYDDNRLQEEGVDPSDIRNIRAEFSQFAKAERLRDIHRFAGNTILRVSYFISKLIGLDAWLATTDNRVVKVLNGLYVFNLPKIGDTVDYMGSQSQPVLIVLDAALNNAENSEHANDNSREIARFIRGEETPDWYRGV